HYRKSPCRCVCGHKARIAAASPYQRRWDFDRPRQPVAARYNRRRSCPARLSRLQGKKKKRPPQRAVKEAPPSEISPFVCRSSRAAVVDPTLLIALQIGVSPHIAI